MRYAAAFILALAVSGAIAHGQEKKSGYGSGYVFAAPGVFSSSGTGFFHVGGGGEVIFRNGLGMGAEIGYVGPMRDMNLGFGVLSVNALYAFRTGERAKTVPFVTGGYSLAFRRGTLNAINFGGGIHYWFRPRLGLRLEFRDQVPPEYFHDHLLQARVGLQFR